MFAYRLVTIETDRRIELPAPLRSGWLDRHDRDCVVTVVERGCVVLTSLRKWGEDRGMTPAEAQAAITEWLENVQPPGLPNVCLAPVSARGRHGNEYQTVTLPPLVLGYLFPLGEGPTAPKGRRRSAPVLARNTGSALYLWGEEGKQFLRSYDEER